MSLITASHQQNTAPVIVARFGSVFGIKGWIKAHSFTTPAENLLIYKPWMIKERSIWTPQDIIQCKPHQSNFIVQIDSINDRDQARKFTNQDIAVPRHVLPGLLAGEYYWRDLIGLKVMTVTGTELGIVDHLIDAHAHSILVVKSLPSGSKHFIPWLPDQGVIEKVSVTEQRITVDWDPDF